MEIRKILAPLSGRFDPDDPQSLDVPALQTAVRLSRHFESRLDVLCVVGPGGAQATGWLSWVPDYGMESVLDAMERQGKIRKKRARKSFESVVQEELEKGAVDAAFIDQAGEISATVGAAGRLSDLAVIANSVSRWEQPFRPILDACLRRTGRPIFVAPQSAPDRIARNIAIAWNDTVQSARAVAGAMPFLYKANTVTVLTAPEDDAASRKANPDKLVEYLRLHGVEAKARTVGGKHRDTPQAIIETGVSDGADLLVLGSVIHSRAHSLVYGSLTEAVLKAPRISALLVP